MCGVHREPRVSQQPRGFRIGKRTPGYSIPRPIETLGWPLGSASLAANRWCFWVFHLEPLVRTASAVRRAKPLAHNALATEGAGMLINHRAVADIGRVDGDAGI
jgi:hypothetical protein